MHPRVLHAVIGRGGKIAPEEYVYESKAGFLPQKGQDLWNGVRQRHKSKDMILRTQG